jgi:protein-S-isoprenylcysteine O-methyltransferase Ste14
MADIVARAEPTIALPIVLLVLFKTVISREEMYLTDAFGAEYTAYLASVRRWL